MMTWESCVIEFGIMTHDVPFKISTTIPYTMQPVIKRHDVVQDIVVKHSSSTTV